MDFRANITPVEVIKKGAFRGTFFRDFYFSVKIKDIKTHGRNVTC